MSGTLRKMRRLAIDEFRADPLACPSARLLSWATRHDARLGDDAVEQRSEVLIPLSSARRRGEITQIIGTTHQAIDRLLAFWRGIWAPDGVL